MDVIVPFNPKEQTTCPEIPHPGMQFKLICCEERIRYETKLIGYRDGNGVCSNCLIDYVPEKRGKSSRKDFKISRIPKTFKEK
jgi:hypothetical protein